MKFLCPKPFLVLLFVCSWVFTYAQPKQPGKVILAQNHFENLKGCLPWPADNIKELVTYKQELENIKKQFGVRGSALKSLTIRCYRPTTIKSIAEGSVQSILDIDNTWSVVVQHGDYLLVYSNLDTVFLKKGDSICTMQPIGRIMNATTNDSFELEMLLYLNRKQLDPYDWFRPMERSQRMYKFAEQQL